jgi:hypothetical protein
MKSQNPVIRFVRAVLAILLPFIVAVSLCYTSIPVSASPDKRSNKSAATTVTFRTVVKYDGWVMEESEDSEWGGQGHTGGFYGRVDVGDDNEDKQMRAILSFNTAALPNDATITYAKLKLKRFAGYGHGDPFKSLHGLYADIKKPAFNGCWRIGCQVNSNALELEPGDFEAPATKLWAAQFNDSPVNAWYVAYIPGQYISRTGAMQFRLRFYKDDNDNLEWDYISFSLGVTNSADRPQLVVTYTR